MDRVCAECALRYQPPPPGADAPPYVCPVCAGLLALAWALGPDEEA